MTVALARTACGCTELELTEDDRARVQACKDTAILDRWVDDGFGATVAAEVLS